MKGKGLLYAYDENLKRLNYLRKKIKKLKLNKKIFIFNQDNKFKNYLI